MVKMKQKECKDCWVAKTHHRIVKEISEDNIIEIFTELQHETQWGNKAAFHYLEIAKFKVVEEIRKWCK